MDHAIWGMIGVVVGSLCTGGATIYSNRLARDQRSLFNDCRLAVNDLKRFRELEDLWADELCKVKSNTSVEKERRRIRTLFPDRIGEFGEPARISKLIDRFDKL